MYFPVLSYLLTIVYQIYTYECQESLTLSLLLFDHYLFTIRSLHQYKTVQSRAMNVSDPKV